MRRLINNICFTGLKQYPNLRSVLTERRRQPHCLKRSGAKKTIATYHEQASFALIIVLKIGRGVDNFGITGFWSEGGPAGPTPVEINWTWKKLCTMSSLHMTEETCFPVPTLAPAAAYSHICKDDVQPLSLCLSDSLMTQTDLSNYYWEMKSSTYIIKEINYSKSLLLVIALMVSKMFELLIVV